MNGADWREVILMKLNAANVTLLFLIFARSAMVLTVISQLSLKAFLT